MEGRVVPLFDADRQLAFAAPRDGDYDVELVYPRRLWLIRRPSRRPSWVC